MSDDRKKDHIELALASRTESNNLDLYYEPLLSAHPTQEMDLSLNFLEKSFKVPLWVSSMTGGTEKAYLINKNLAKLCSEFGFGMGLGSCRPLLKNKEERLKDFDFKEIIGDQAFYINLGIAQLEELVFENRLEEVTQICNKLQADGLIIHVNPLQEWLQPEGDRFKLPPIETIKTVLERISIKVIVKEVGQGFGPNSLLSLMKLPLAAIELAGFGGTNFTLLEHSRHNAQSSGKNASNLNLSYIGHTPSEMINWINQYQDNGGIKCRDFIISGGIKNVLEGYKLQESLNTKSIIGMASSFLQYAHDYELLKDFTYCEIENLKLAHCFLRGK